MLNMKNNNNSLTDFEILELWSEHLAYDLCNVIIQDLNCQKQSFSFNLENYSNIISLNLLCLKSALNKPKEDDKLSLNKKLKKLNMAKYIKNCHPIYKYQHWLQQKALNYIPLSDIETINNFKLNCSIKFQFSLFFENSSNNFAKKFQIKKYSNSLIEKRQASKFSDILNKHISTNKNSQKEDADVYVLYFKFFYDFTN